MVTFPKYESYKDSGVEWLGEIPSHWKLQKSKYLWREVEERSISGDEQLLSVSQYSGVIPRNEDSRSESLLDYKQCKPNDLVINIMLAWMGGLDVSQHNGIVSPAYCVYRLRQVQVSKYLGYLYKTPLYLAEFARHSKGVVPSRWRMYTEDFGQVLTLLPSVEEQKRIVKFLDRKTSEIDQAIAQKQRLIELLQEQKAILINQAVTKGLDPNVPMKDSCIEWIGEIPAYWKLTQLKYCCQVIKDGLHLTPAKHDEGINFISTQHIRNRRIAIDKATYISENDYKLGHPRVKPEVGDVLVTLVGSIGFAALVAREHMPLSCTRHVGYVRCKPNHLAQEYLIDYTESHIFKCFVEENVSQTAQPSIYLATLASHRLPLPPLDEQMEISKWLSKAIKHCLEAIDTALQEISIFQELKQVYIAEAVTGKIKV